MKSVLVNFRMTVSVLRFAGADCTNNGITSLVSSVVLIGENDPIPETPHYVFRAIYCPQFDTWTAVPADGPKLANEVGPMFGGNFLFSSDSRFRDIFGAPIPAHDRFESGENK
jgi:hypothetical protein